MANNVIPGLWDSVSVPTIQTSPVSWVYQLQNVEAPKMGACLASFKVIDQTRDGKTPWSAFDVKKMKGSSKILCYLSIGEAENYRSYWKKDWQHGYPSFIDEENPDWPGNYKVRYWDPLWQTLIFRQVSQAVDQGFDGVYLDIIDAYEFYEDQGIGTAAALMRRFVKDIARAARAKNKNFLIFTQNGEALIDDESYLNTIDGLGVEDLVLKSSDTQLASRSAYLKQALNAGKTVMCVEYTNEPDTGLAFVNWYANKGMLLYLTDRALNVLTAPIVLR